MKKKVTYIISNIDKAIAFEWIVENIDKSRFTLSFILLNPGDSHLEGFLKKNNIQVDRITYHGKKSLLKAILKIRTLLKKDKTQTIHTHLFDANLAGLTAAWLAGVPKRIHTRHHSDYHHVYYPKMIKYDRYINKRSTHIVSISKMVTSILVDEEKVNPSKISLIHHGFKLNEFNLNNKQKVNGLAINYNSLNKHPVIGVISRYTDWKGIQYIIPAFKQLLVVHPDALLILANANGNHKNEIQELLKGIPKKNYHEIAFEPDIFSLYHLFDVFVHVPISDKAEAFGQIYVEALAAGIPSVFTLSGIANEFIVDKENALVVPHKDSRAIFNAINTILTNKTLAEHLRDNGKKNVQTLFELNTMINKLEELYGE